MEYYYPANESTHQTRYPSYAGHAGVPYPNDVPHPVNDNHSLYHEQQPLYQLPPPLPPSTQAPEWNEVQGSTNPSNHFGVLPELPSVSAPSSDWDFATWEAFIAATTGPNSNDHGVSPSSLTSMEQSNVSATENSASLPQVREQPGGICPHCKGQYNSTLTVHLKSECTMSDRFTSQRRPPASVHRHPPRGHHHPAPYDNEFTTCDKNLQTNEGEAPDMYRTSRRPPPRITKSIISICHRCNLPFPDGESQLHHAMRTCPMRSAQFKCQRCQTPFPRRKDLSRHEKMLPDRNGLTACDKFVKARQVQL
ncbi:hypothetical protein ONZ45_g3359 [Pleurotus djamor]|nr:hypothetical protein ONZ45_g3359 [Pleurotus djamor]